MKKYLLSALLSFVAWTAFSQTWKLDPAHSRLAFATVHFGISDVSGQFNTFQGSITSSKPDFSDAVFELTAEIKSLDTEVEMRDNHLKSADFFDAEKFPTLTFKSTGLQKNGDNKYKLTGDLTLHGVTKPVTLELQYRGSLEHPQTKKMVAGFQAIGVIKRSDFGIGTKFPNNMLSDEVRIKADGEFQQQ